MATLRLIAKAVSIAVATWLAMSTTMPVCAQNSGITHREIIDFAMYAEELKNDESSVMEVDAGMGGKEIVTPLDEGSDLPEVEPIYLDEEMPPYAETYGMKPQFMVPYPGSQSRGCDECGCGDVCEECRPSNNPPRCRIETCHMSDLGLGRVLGLGGGLCCLGGWCGGGSSSQCNCPQCQQARAQGQLAPGYYYEQPMPPGYMPGFVPQGIASAEPARVGLAAEVDLMLLRLHVLEGSFGAGKLSEDMNFSPRVILYIEEEPGFGGRARYWHYGALTESLGAGDDIRFEFDVLDLELYGRLTGQRTEFIFSGGARLAQVDEPAGAKLEAFGLTFAADGRTRICARVQGEWSWLYGARLSLLGGDWEGGPLPLHDDNLVVEELYVGVGYRQRVGRMVIDGALAVESQNWHSDYFSETSLTDSVSLIGPKLVLGASF